MKLAKKQNSGFASPPEYGAIVMSNTTTKKECLRRKLFGLSSRHYHFVKHIKAGMILFLFEYERRELYGVFEACSDGAMNIVPNAFSSSGMHCPAQVKFKTIWVCEPLPESEFHYAIKENYFAAKKFNFGLSKAQVWRLLLLFSSRKLGEPERRLAKFRNAKSTVNPLDKVKQVDDNRCKVNDEVNGVYVWGNSDVDIESKSATTMEDVLLDFDKVESDNSKSAMYGWGRNEYRLQTELQPAILSEHTKYNYGEVRRLPGDEIHMNDGLQIECYKDIDFELVARSGYPSLLQSKLSASNVSPKPLFVPNPLVSGKIKPHSPFHYQMDSQLLANLSSKACYRDAVVTSSLPFDSVALGFNHKSPSSNEVNFQSPIERRLSPDGCSDNVISSSRKQPFSSYQDPKGINDLLNKNLTFGDHVPFSGPSPNENSYCGTIMGFSPTAYFENLDTESLKNQSYTGVSSLRFSLADMPSVRTTINPEENKFSSYYPFSSNKDLSLVDDCGYQIEPEDHLKHEAAWRRKGEAFMDSSSSSYVDPFTLQGCISSVDPHSMQHYEDNYDLEPYQSSDTLHSVPSKNRISVFSRLAFAPNAHLSEHNADIHSELSEPSKSVDQIMEMLHKNHTQWVKLKNSKQGNKQDDVDKLGNKRKATVFCKAEIGCLKVLAKDNKVGCLPAGADNIKVDRSLAGAEEVKLNCSKEKVSQSSEAKSFLNFKRRSEMRKLHHDTSTTCCNATLASEDVLAGQQKKRKLVRPNFSKNDNSDDKGVKNYTSILQASAQEISIMKDKTGGCEASTVNQNEENGISFQSGKETHLMSQSNHGDRDFNRERRDARVRSCKSSPRIGDEVGKESASKEINFQNATIPDLCEEKNPDGDLTINGSPLDHKSSHFFVQEILLRVPKENNGSGNKFAEDECERKNKAELLLSAQSIAETCTNSSVNNSTMLIKRSSNQFSELQREGKEQTAIHVDTCKENVQQISPSSRTKLFVESFEKPELSREDYRKKRKLKRWNSHE